MPDVFISYRRDEGLAVKVLHAALDERFDVFFDLDRRSIKPGEPFPDKIRAALHDCRVVVVVIGREWISDKNRARLADPNDWVKAEIESALTAGARVIPVLFDNVSPATLATLDEPLRQLASLQNVALALDTFDERIDQLIDEVDACLREPDRRPRAPTLSPPLLPQLCDRVPQEDALIEVFTDGGVRTMTPVIVVHGHKWDDHVGFLERVKYKRTLADLLGGESGIAIEPLQWDIERAVAGEYAKALLAAVRRNVLKSPTATREDVVTYFESVRQPHCLVLSLTAEDCQRCGATLMANLLAAWGSLFAAERGGHPVVVDPPQRVVLWVNISHTDPRAGADIATLPADSAGRAVALPPLRPLRESDLTDWLQLGEVQPFVADKTGAILNLLDDPQTYLEKGSIHMRRFADAVASLLARADA
jgi:hypothetical protein